jgi:hypothetical protein
MINTWYGLINAFVRVFFEVLERPLRYVDHASSSKSGYSLSLQSRTTYGLDNDAKTQWHSSPSWPRHNLGAISHVTLHYSVRKILSVNSTAESVWSKISFWGKWHTVNEEWLGAKSDAVNKSILDPANLAPSIFSYTQLATIMSRPIVACSNAGIDSKIIDKRASAG